MEREIDKNSMVYWWPKIKDLPIPQPKTEFIEVDPKLAFQCADGKESYDFDEFKRIAKKIGYPLFLRSDQLSGKHEWKDTCFVEKEKNLIMNVARVTEATLSCDIMGLPVNAFFFREYIPMKNLFTAFWGEMPVNPEMRIFVKDGQLVCTHWYWIEDAIIDPSVKNWREIIAETKKSLSEVSKILLRDYSKEVSKTVEGYWSVDFCQAKDGRWILIDMALAENSWHPKDCPKILIKKKEENHGRI